MSTTKRAPAWTGTNIEIAMAYGMQPAEAFLHRDVPGLAVVVRASGGYTVTHVSSGYAIGPRPGLMTPAEIPSKAAAKRFLLALRDVADWTADKDGVLAQRESIQSALTEARRLAFGDAQW